MATDGSPQRTAAADRPRTSGAAIASLILALVGLFRDSADHVRDGDLPRTEGAGCDRREPGLSGGRLAKAGVILGWIGVA